MCRIAGYIGNKATRRVATIIRGLTVAEDKSNPHGTGIVVRNSRTHDSQVMKKGIRGRSYLVQGYADFLYEKHFNMAFLHVRYMTTGEQSDRCSHPFGFRVNGQWHFGMHNGVFSDLLCTRISEEFGCSKAKVDSETFFRALQTLQNGGKSLEESITTLTEFIGIEGAYAFAYMTTDSVYLWRSEGRPLSVFDLREGNLGRWFCSTPEMFKKGLTIAGMKSVKGSSFDVKPYRLYRIGHKTSPALEAEAVCNLPKPPAPPKQDFKFSPGSAWETEQGCLWEEPSCDDELLYEDPETLSDRALNRKIDEVATAFNEDSYYEEYLSELIYEKEMRRGKGGVHAKAS